MREELLHEVGVDRAVARAVRRVERHRLVATQVPNPTVKLALEGVTAELERLRSSCLLAALLRRMPNRKLGHLGFDRLDCPLVQQAVDVLRHQLLWDRRLRCSRLVVRSRTLYAASPNESDLAQVDLAEIEVLLVETTRRLELLVPLDGCRPLVQAVLLVRVARAGCLLEETRLEQGGGVAPAHVVRLAVGGLAGGDGVALEVRRFRCTPSEHACRVACRAH